MAWAHWVINECVTYVGVCWMLIMGELQWEIMGDKPQR